MGPLKQRWPEVHVGEIWESGPYQRWAGRGGTVEQSGEVRVVGFENRRRERYAVVEQADQRFRVRLDQFNADTPSGFYLAKRS